MKYSTVSPLLVIFTAALIIAACQPSEPETPTAPTNQEESSSDETQLADQGEENEVEDDVDADSRSLSVNTSYISPAGPEEVGFTLVVDSAGTIVEAETEVLGKAPISIMRQESFAEEFPTVLVGRQLSELTEVDRVGGSSLTTAAFNEALEQLKAQI